MFFLIVIIVSFFVVIISNVITLFLDSKSNSKNTDSDINSSTGFYYKTGYGDLTFFKKELIKKNGAICEMCGQTEGPLQVDHIIPISRGGTNEISNMQLLCYECHTKKHNYYFDEFGYSSRKVPKKYLMLNEAYKNGSKIEIKYKKYDGSITKRIIKPVTQIYYKEYGKRGAYYITAFCYLRKEDREFKISRIINIKDNKE